jgi:hypothetical protein
MMAGIQQHSAFVSSRHEVGFCFKADSVLSESGIEDTSRTGFSLSASPWASDIPSLEDQAPCKSIKPKMVLFDRRCKLRANGSFVYLANPLEFGHQTSANSFSQATPTMSIPQLNTDTSASKSQRLINYLPLAEHSAFDTFEILDNNLLYDKSLGCSHQSLDTMICDCQYDPCKRLASSG